MVSPKASAWRQILRALPNKTISIGSPTNRAQMPSWFFTRSHDQPGRDATHAGFRLSAALACGILCHLTAAFAWSHQADLPRDLSFADAVRIAEAVNPAFLAARNLVDIAEADARASIRRSNPVLSVEGEEYAAFETALPDFWDEQAIIVRLDQELETVGQRQLRKRASRIRIEETQSIESEARRQLYLQIGRAYFGLALAHANLVASREMVRDLDRVIALTESRVSAGESAGMDLRRLRVERLHFMDELLAAELDMSTARVTLLSQLGAPGGTLNLDALDPLDSPPLYGPDGDMIASRFGVVASAEALLDYALDVRPDLRATQHALEGAQTEIALQRRMQIPDITVAVGYRRDFGHGGMDFGIEIPIPLFGNVNAGGLQRAVAEHRRAEFQELDSRLAVARELRIAVEAVKFGAQRVSQMAEQFESTVAELSAAVQASYELGEAALIDFLDVQRELAATRQVRNRALYELRVSLLELAVALGLPPA